MASQTENPKITALCYILALDGLPLLCPTLTLPTKSFASAEVAGSSGKVYVPRWMRERVSAPPESLLPCSTRNRRRKKTIRCTKYDKTMHRKEQARGIRLKPPSRARMRPTVGAEGRFHGCGIKDEEGIVCLFDR